VSGLTVTGCVQHISVIVRACTEAAADELAVTDDIGWLLVQFSDWLHMALLMCFRGDKQVRAEITRYKWPCDNT